MQTKQIVKPDLANPKHAQLFAPTGPGGQQEIMLDWTKEAFLIRLPTNGPAMTWRERISRLLELVDDRLGALIYTDNRTGVQLQYFDRKGQMHTIGLVAGEPKIIKP